jgi:hypothetical protein
MPPVRHAEAIRAGLFALALALLTTRGLPSPNAVGGLEAAVDLELALALASRGEPALSVAPSADSSGSGLLAGHRVPSRPVASMPLYRDRGVLRPASAPGHALLALPLVGVARLLAPDAPIALQDLRAPRQPDTAAVRSTARIETQRDPRAIAFVLFGALCAALTAAWFAQATVALGLSASARAAGLAALLLGSPWLLATASPSSVLPATAALSFVLARLVAREAGSRVRDRGIGLAAALAVLARPEALAFVVLAGSALYAIERGWRRAPSRAIARLILPVALVFAGLAAWGWPESGDAWSLARLPVGALSLATSLAFCAPFASLALARLGMLRSRARPIASLVLGSLVLAGVLYGGSLSRAAASLDPARALLPCLPVLALSWALAFERFGPRARALAWAGIGLFALALSPRVLLDLPEFQAFSVLDPLGVGRAWGTLIEAAPRALSAFACASVRVPAYAVLGGLAAVGGLVLSRARFAAAQRP